MRRGLRFCSIAAFASVLIASTSAAEQLSLTMKDGRVSLVADNVTVRQILAEWARVGQTRIINGDRVPGAPVTLRLIDVPEQTALETLLRNVSGYLAAPRPTEVSAASVFDRIMILPTSSAPAATGPGPGRTATSTAPMPPTPMPMPVQIPADGEEPEVEEAPQNAPFVPFNAPRPQEFENANPQGNQQHRGPMGPVPQPVYQGPAPTPTTPQPFFTAPVTTGRPGEIVQPPAGQVPGMPAGVVPGVQRPAPPQPVPPQD